MTKAELRKLSPQELDQLAVKLSLQADEARKEQLRVQEVYSERLAEEKADALAERLSDDELAALAQRIDGAGAVKSQEG